MHERESGKSAPAASPDSGACTSDDPTLVNSYVARPGSLNCSSSSRPVGIKNIVGASESKLEVGLEEDPSKLRPELKAKAFKMEVELGEAAIPETEGGDVPAETLKGWGKVFENGQYFAFLSCRQSTATIL